MNIEKEELVRRLKIAEPYNNQDVPQYIWSVINGMPPAEPEKTVYIPDTKAIPTERSCVDLAEEVTATFYDEEHEEWTQQTVTIADVLDSVCDEYTILPFAERKGKWVYHTEPLTYRPYGYYTCSLCNEMSWDESNYCPNCGAHMEGRTE